MKLGFLLEVAADQLELAVQRSVGMRDSQRSYADEIVDALRERSKRIEDIVDRLNSPRRSTMESMEMLAEALRILDDSE